MHIDVKRPDYQSIEFWFHPDELDAEPPLPMVFATAQNLGRVREEKLALCGYCLARDLIGNYIAFEGVNVPAHLAAAVQSDFQGHELFIGPITNRPKKIEVKGEPKVGVFESGENDVTGLDRPARVTEWELGFRCIDESGTIDVMRTNARLWAGLSCPNPDALARTLCLLLMSDAYGIGEFRHVEGMVGADSFGGNVQSLCREVAINVV